MEISHPDYQRNLGNGYLLRWGTPNDADAYGELAAAAFYLKNEGVGDPNVITYAHDLLSGNHPLCQPSDVAVIVDEQQQLVAAAALMQQPLEYAGIAIPTGRPELVCSSATTRNQGFIRHIMQALHVKSAARGDLLQAITGIPNYYHQFGYAWSVDYDAYCQIRVVDLPALQPHDTRITARRANVNEYATFAAMYDQDRRSDGILLSSPFPQEWYTHLLTTSVSSESYHPYFLTEEMGTVVGYVLVSRRIWEGYLTISGFGIRADQSYQRLMVPMLHAVAALAADIPKPLAQHPDLHTINLQVDGRHPAHTHCDMLKIPYTVEPPYTWYLRMPNVRQLIWHLRSVLEARIAHSALRGYTGTISISTYTDGFAMTWQNGVLTQVAPWMSPEYGDGADAGYPPGILAQHLFGWRSLDELRDWRPDVWANSHTAIVLNILFPKQPSRFLWMN